MKTLTVKFTTRYTGSNYSANKEYHYVVDDNVVVSAGDFGVAHNGSEYAIVQIVAVQAGASSRATKTLVTVLTKEMHKEYLDRNDKINEQKQLFARLEQLLAQESENDKFRRLADSNAEAKLILEKLGIV